MGLDQSEGLYNSFRRLGIQVSGEFFCENLKQIEYGRIDVTEFGRYGPTGQDPFTPVIWASFITGLMPEQHGVMATRQYSDPISEVIRKLLFKFGLKDTISIHRKEWIKSKFLAPLGLCKIHSKIDELWKIDKEYYEKRRIRTIFNFCNSPVIVAMPTYKDFEKSQEMHALVEAYLNRKISRTEFLRGELDFLDEEIHEAVMLLKNRKWDLFVFYTKVIDWVGHFLAWNTRAMWQIYERADNLVKETEELVGDNAFILVISDHGMKKSGRHSDHAFYSVNIPLKLKKPKMTDFYCTITEKLADKCPRNI